MLIHLLLPHSFVAQVSGTGTQRPHGLQVRTIEQDHPLQIPMIPRDDWQGSSVAEHLPSPYKGPEFPKIKILKRVVSKLTTFVDCWAGLQDCIATVKFRMEVLFTAVHKHRDQKHGGEGGVYFHLQFTIHDEGKTGRKLKQRPWRLLWLPYTTQHFLPMGGTAQSRLVPPTSVVNQENAPQACKQTNLMEAFSQL